MKKQKEEVEDIKKTYVVGTTVGNNGFYCKVREKPRNGVKCISKRQTEETKKQRSNK